MTQPIQYFRTLSGDPPFGGVPPGVRICRILQRSAPAATPAASPPPPSYAEHPYSRWLDPSLYPPQQAAQPPPPCYVEHDYSRWLDPRIYLPPQAAQPPPQPAPQAPAILDASMLYQALQTLQALLAPAPAPAPILAPAPAPQLSTPPGSSLLGPQAPNSEGVQCLLPHDQTVFHVIRDPDMRPDALITLPAFTPRSFPSGLIVAELIRALVPTINDARIGVMEVHQQGDGRWTAGTMVLLNSDLAKKTLREIGWDETRGSTAAPVWIKLVMAT
ncbi:hypothetical protein XPA_003662 [Xanthoria parietina]